MRWTELYRSPLARYAYFSGKRRASSGDVENAIAWFKRAAQLSPDNSRAQYEAHWQRAELLMTMGRATEAIPDLRALANVNPGDVGIRKRLACLIEEAEGNLAAITAWRQVLALSCDDFDVHNRLATLLETAGRKTEAIPHVLKIAAAEGSSTVKPWRRLARLIHETNGAEEAIAAWRRVLTILPEDIEAHKRLATLLETTGRKSEAVPHAWKVLATTKPGDVKPLRRLARLIQETRGGEEAIVAWRQVLAVSPSDADAHTRLANLLLAANRKMEALPYLQAAADNSTDIRILRRLARLTEDLCGREQAIAAWRQVLTAVGSEEVEAHARLARLLLGAGRKREALPHVRVAALADPRGDAKLLARWARLVEETSDANEAINAWKHVLATAPEDLDARKRLAILLQDTGRHDEALHHFSLVAGVRSQDKKVLRRLARSVEATFGGEQAIAAWRQVLIVVGSEDVEAHMRLARLLLASGRIDDAACHFQALAIATTSGDPIALRRVERLLDRLESLLFDTARLIFVHEAGGISCDYLLRHMIAAGHPLLGVLAVKAMADFAGPEAMLEKVLSCREFLAMKETAQTISRYLMLLGRFEEAARINEQHSLLKSDDPTFPDRVSKLITKISRIRKRGQSKTISRQPDREIQIAGVPWTPALGDLTMHLAFLAGAKLHFADASLVVITEPLNDGAAAAIECCPYIDEHIVVRRGSIGEIVAQRSKSGTVVFARGFYDLGALEFAHRALDHYDIKAPFVIPEAKLDLLHRDFIKRGVAPDRWLVTMHCRHNGSYRLGLHKDFVRDVSPHAFSQLANYIIDELGGQVVFLGHPGMPRPQDRNGLYWFGDAPVLLQNYAIARSRYFVGCDSGPVMTASAFQVPTLKSNSIYNSGAWNTHDIMLPKNILTSDACVISFNEVWNNTRLHWMPGIHRFEEFFIVDNTFEQLRSCVLDLHQRTTELSGLRTLRPPATSIHPPDQFLVRGESTPSRQIIDLSHLLGRPLVPASAILQSASVAAQRTKEELGQ